MMRTPVMSVFAFGMFLSTVSCASKESLPRTPHSGISNSPATSSTQAAKQLALSLGNGVTLQLIQIPAGKFIMGNLDTGKELRDESPPHEVTITMPFYLGIYEVTVDQYAQFVKATGQRHVEPSFRQTGNHPVVNVSWDDAQAFCQWLSKKTGKTVVLPTEAQWEYACRAGSKKRFSFGDNDADLCKYGNYADRANTNNLPFQDKLHTDGFDKTSPVGSFKPNAWGLFDMLGNAWEWCADFYAWDYATAGTTDPSGPWGPEEHVVRGGCWSFNPPSCTSSWRAKAYPDYRNEYGGFRVAVMATAKE